MRLVLAIAVALVACKRPDAKPKQVPAGAGGSWGDDGTRDAGAVEDLPPPVPAGSLVVDPIEAWYAVVLPKPASATLLGALEAVARRRGFAVGGDPPEAWAVIRASSPADAGYDAAEDLVQLRVPEEDLPRVKSATGAIVLGAGGAADGLDTYHGLLVDLARQAASEGHGWVLDLQTATIRDLDGLDDGSAKAAHDAATLTGYFADDEPGGDGLTTIETSGMSRFGLPELRVAHVPNGMLYEVEDLVDASAQTLLDHGGLTADGELAIDVAALPTFAEMQAWVHDHEGTGKVRWRVTWAEATDDDERILELAATGRGEATARLGLAVDGFYGTSGLGTVEFDLDQPEVRATTERVQADLLALGDAFAHGVPTGESLRVLAPFPQGDGQYWLWVEVTHSKAGSWLRGTVVDSAPQDVDAVLGSQVDVLVSDVIDYKHQRADGTTVGPLQAFDADD